MPTPGDPTEHLDRLPPEDRQTIQTNEPMVRAILALLGKRTTRRLGQVSTKSRICAQQLDERNHEGIPLSGPHGVPSTSRLVRLTDPTTTSLNSSRAVPYGLR